MTRRPISQRELDDALELMYFGFKRLVADPDRVLARRGLGRIHHRILYFVCRLPALSMGRLLRELGVTKQAVHEPVRALLRRGFVTATADPRDRRVRRLSPTPAGIELERQLTGLQHARLAQVFGEAGPTAHEGWKRVMRLLGDRPEAGSESVSEGRARPAGSRAG
ncbi:MAG: MarR family transcriptional regulator [Gemmatimonadales bacterium]